MSIVGLLGGLWLVALLGVGILVGVAWPLYSRRRTDKLADEPWPWPSDFRAKAEAMARPIDPTPKRIVPPHEGASEIAQVATTKEALSRLIADKPPAWPWAVFTSVLVQRRNALQTRLRSIASGYQPRSGAVPLDGHRYSVVAYEAMEEIADIGTQAERFLLSPAFKGAFGADGDHSADADGIVSIANRLMDYHEAFLRQAEICLQTPVEVEAIVFLQDMGAFAMSPLIGYEKFIPTMCSRIGEAQELLPYTSEDTVIKLDEVLLDITLPDGLMDRVFAHVRHFNN